MHCHALYKQAQDFHERVHVPDYHSENFALDHENCEIPLTSNKVKGKSLPSAFLSSQVQNWNLFGELFSLFFKVYNKVHVGKSSFCYTHPCYLCATFLPVQGFLILVEWIMRVIGHYPHLKKALYIFFYILLTRLRLVSPLPPPFSKTKVIVFIKLCCGKTAL